MDRFTTQKIIKKDIETQTHKKPRHLHATRIFTNIQRSKYDNDIIKKACSRKKATNKNTQTRNNGHCKCNKLQKLRTNTNKCTQNKAKLYRASNNARKYFNRLMKRKIYMQRKINVQKRTLCRHI